MRIFFSIPDAEYLEEKFPQPALYSSDPYQRALERIYFNHWTKKVIKENQDWGNFKT